MENKIIETAERIVMDYADLSGRETANRAEFRKRTIEHLKQLYNNQNRGLQSLITEEILIAMKERQPTSRLTSLSNRISELFANTP